MTALLYFEKYGRALASDVRSASWPLSPSVRASVNGTSKTVGSVPAASLAANVGPVHWYSTGLTLIEGFAFSNCATWALNCWIAAAVLPGISDATLIVTVFVDDPVLAAAVAHTASRPIAATMVVTVRMDFIVLPFLDLCMRCSVSGKRGGRLIRDLAQPDRRVVRKCTSFELVA